MPCLNFQLPLEQHQTNSCFQDADDVEDSKRQPAIDDDDDYDDSFGGTDQDFSLDSEDVTLAALGNSSTKKGKLTYQFVARRQQIWFILRKQIK
jgi:hypothetical protein